MRFRPPEVAAGLQRLELAREHLAVRLQMGSLCQLTTSILGNHASQPEHVRFVC